MEIHAFDSACFNGVTFRGWRDTFTFQASAEPVVVKEAITSFFEKRGADLARPEPLLLRRGRRFWRYFAIGPELWADHTISAHVEGRGEAGSTVTVAYQVPGWWIRVRPYQTDREVAQLVAELRVA